MLAFVPFLGVNVGFLLGSRESWVPLTLWPNLLGAGLAYRGGAFAAAGVPIDGLPPSCGFRRGDSGRGREGLDFLKPGLGALPGPTDWLNFGSEGVGGVMAVGPCPATLTPPPTEGVVGVRGTEPSCEDGEPRRMALLMGRNMPAPGIVVTKY